MDGWITRCMLSHLPCKSPQILAPAFPPGCQQLCTVFIHYPLGGGGWSLPSCPHRLLITPGIVSALAKSTSPVIPAQAFEPFHCSSC